LQDDPSLPPFWSSDSELPMLIELLEGMSTSTQPRIGQQILQIYQALCTHFGLAPLAGDEKSNIEKV
jgi:hypothetical protein